MDDAREWTATAPRAPAAVRAPVQPGDPWGAPLGAGRVREEPRDERATAAGLGPPAGFWRRAIGLAVDVVVLTLLVRAGFWLAVGLAALTPGLHLVSQAFGLTWLGFAPAAYFVLSHGTSGQTVGKRLVGVRVIAAAGGPIGYTRALGRCLATGLALLPLGLGLALAGLTPERRGLHDLLAGTRVVRVR